MTMSSIFQDKIIENERETSDIITEEISSMLELFPEDANEDGGNNYVKDPLSTYKSTSDPDTLYHHQDMKVDDRKEFLLAMIKKFTDQINNGNFLLIRRE